MNRDMRFKIDATWAQLPKPGKRDVAAISMTLGERVFDAIAGGWGQSTARFRESVGSFACVMARG